MSGCCKWLLTCIGIFVVAGIVQFAQYSWHVHYRAAVSQELQSLRDAAERGDRQAFAEIVRRVDSDYRFESASAMVALAALSTFKCERIECALRHLNSPSHVTAREAAILLSAETCTLPVCVELLVPLVGTDRPDVSWFALEALSKVPNAIKKNHRSLKAQVLRSSDRELLLRWQQIEATLVSQ